MVSSLISYQFKKPVTALHTNARFGSIPAILISDWDTTIDGISLPEEIRKEECGLSAGQKLGDLDGVEGCAFASIVRHDPLDTIYRDTISVRSRLHDPTSK